MTGIEQLKHIVVLMMENRSFDHMLGFSKIPGIDGLSGSETNPDTTNEPAPVKPLAAQQGQLQPDPGHHFEDVKLQIHGDQPGEA
ncbi:MAG: alkaline phosphatase family protein, partial [Bryobacteraceae bacterium]